MGTSLLASTFVNSLAKLQGETYYTDEDLHHDKPHIINDFATLSSNFKLEKYIVNDVFWPSINSTPYKLETSESKSNRNKIHEIPNNVLDNSGNITSRRGGEQVTKSQFKQISLKYKTREQEELINDHIESNPNNDDSYSESSENGSASSENIQYVQVTRHSQSYKMFYEKQNKVINTTFSSDPYLESHRLRLNDRQKGRVKKLNETFRVLNGVIPNEINDGKLRPYSKLGVLQRAIAYMKQLENQLSDEPLTMPADDVGKVENSVNTTSDRRVFTGKYTRDE